MPDHVSEAELRFQWKIAREENREFTFEVEGQWILTLYPAEIPWYAVMDTFNRCSETTAAFTTGTPLQCALEMDHEGAHEFSPE